MAAPITVAPIIPLGPDTIINGNPYQIAGRPTPQPLSSSAASIGSMGLGGYTPQQSANVSNLLRAALPMQQSAPALPAMPAASLMGLFRDRNPLAQGLLAAGKALTDYGAPSTMPKGGFMGALGAGGQGFTAGYQAGEDANLANRLAAYKLYSDGRQKPFAVGNRVYDPNPGGGFIEPQIEPFNFEGTGERFTDAEKSFITTASQAGPENAGKALFDVTKQKRGYEKDLRGEFNKNSEGLAKILGAARRAQQLELRQGKQGVSDLETLYSFITALDPNSVVREGEVALARQISSIVESFELRVDQVNKGILLPGEVGTDLRARIMELGDAAQQRLEKDIQYYTQQEDELALRPSSVVRPITGFTRDKAPPTASTNPYGVPPTIGG